MTRAMQIPGLRTTTPAPILLLAALVLPPGCKKSADTAEPTADGPTTATAPATETDQDSDANPTSITIDPKIAEMCSIPTAHFEFDSSALGASAEQALDALAACFVDGPAAGNAMRLVGHADPRGTEEYNLALGQRRAGSVAGYLGGKGLEEATMETSSRGELDAGGTDEPSWALDRKVEILLAE
jgi:peptidoglycan-associated lipoprotein